MKKTLILFTMLLGIAAFSTKGFAQDQPKDEWPELTAFHKVMAQTFHPSEEGDLTPIKKRSGEMLEKAVVLEKSAMPDYLNTKSVKDALKELREGAEKLDKMVKAKADDAKLTKALSDLHDVFHKVAGACNHEEQH